MIFDDKVRVVTHPRLTEGERHEREMGGSDRHILSGMRRRNPGWTGERRPDAVITRTDVGHYQ
jgi:hypothetical protein